MKVTLFLAIFMLMLMSIANANNHASATCPIPQTNTPIPAYFKEMNKILKLLSVFEPYSDARPANATFERSAKRLFRLGRTMDQASQVLMQQNGDLDKSSVEKIDNSLKLSVQYVVNITKLVEYGKPLSDKYNYTAENVQIIQGVTSQYSTLFKALIAHVPHCAAYSSITLSFAKIICALVEAMEYLQPGAFAKGGKEFCDQLPTNKNPPNPEEIECIFTPPAAFTQCGNSTTAMFKYGTDNNLMGKPQSSEWCPSNGNPSTCTYHPSCAFSQSSAW
ncbi:uncharacterized protein FA14DRAFT_158587 [Meira miltonrushii]|uniref:Uncharacterized protein n=1 Tax=Meira miltonrushii TaxID=1280837 RepID=A0A316V8H0_9BASI|nr:uncharacterized protein FA14DRAFT_158587 [Meira miltonrushii]PWN31775.1 hypothetical protein FA14DRAFT_158587 [Meira miltonrushii]